MSERDFIEIKGVTAPLSDAVTALPPSKSISARALTAAFHCRALPALRGLSDCADTQHLRRAFETLAAPGAAAAVREIFIGEGAASLRFLLPAAAGLEGVTTRIIMGAQLARRPEGVLPEALRSLGADIKRTSAYTYTIQGRPLSGTSLSLDLSHSSQSASALMLSAPAWPGGLTITYDSRRAVSVPYIAMTRRVMESFGAICKTQPGRIAIAPVPYSAPAAFTVEPDWSAASYFYELAILRPGEPVRIERLTRPDESAQGDSAAAAIFARLGAKTEFRADGSAIITARRPASDRFEADMRHCPDLVPALAVALAASGIPFIISGIAHLKEKESDRIAAIAAGLRACGFAARAGADSLTGSGLRTQAQASTLIDTRSDHRIAMAFAPLAATGMTLRLTDPACTAKSFPAYFPSLRSLYS